MIWVLLGFVFGCIFSAIIYIVFRRHRTSGNLHIVQTEDPSNPYIFLELNDDPKTIIFHRTVLLNVNSSRGKHVL